MSEQTPEQTPDVAAELAAMGRKLRETITTAWNSQERQQIQQEIQEGLQRLSAELEGAVETVRASEPGQKVEAGAKQIRDDIQSGKMSDDVRRGIINGLRAVSQALDKLAENFTPLEAEDEEPAKKKPKKTSKAK
jgi:hypothetical protein